MTAAAHPDAILCALQGVALARSGNQILRDIQLDIHRNEILTIIGPNGAGKSSLLHIIAGLVQPSEGRVTREKRLRVGYVPQKLRIDNSLPMKVSRFLSLSMVDKVTQRQALKHVNAAHLWDRQLHGLSGGELQRVLLARAIARQPQLLLLDEPLQGVDVNGQAELYRLIAQIREELECAIVMVSHDLHLVMAQTDKVICLNQHICCAGQPESVSQHPEYLSLFGRQQAQDIAVYTHHHDHHHNLHGAAVDCGAQCRHD